MLIAQTVAGLVLLLVAAELLVRGSVALARRLGVPALVVGLTVVAFGTSAPELMVSLNAALAGSPGIAMGNVVGSNIANVLLIMGVGACIVPVAGNPAAYRRDAGLVLAATLVFMAIVFTGDAVARWQGVILAALLVAYLVYAYRRERDDPHAIHAEEAQEFAGFTGSLWVALLATLGGIAGILLGADWLVGGSAGLARLAGVPEEVIGLTIVAFGTSLPELATVVVAGLRGHTDVGVGNILGSNLFNLLGVLGVTAAVVPVPVHPRVATFDVWVVLLAILALGPFMVTGRHGRPAGALMLAAYIAYIVFQYMWQGPVPGMAA